MFYNFRIIFLCMGQYKRISGFFLIISPKEKKNQVKASLHSIAWEILSIKKFEIVKTKSTTSNPF